MIKDGISIIKENASTALGTIVEKIGEDFKPYFEETIQFLISYIGEFHTSAYKQFRGQAIEAITIICSAVGIEAFRVVADNVIGVML